MSFQMQLRLTVEDERLEVVVRGQIFHLVNVIEREIHAFEVERRFKVEQLGNHVIRGVQLQQIRHMTKWR